MNTTYRSSGLKGFARVLLHGTDPISDKELAAFAPSIFATKPHKDVSEIYGFLPTTTILAALRKEGFVPMEARQYVRRDASRIPFTKHMMRFRVSGDKPQIVGDCVPQIVLINSHDRSSRAELYGGLFRLVCSNGLLVSESSVVAPAIVRHTKNPVAELLENVEAIVKDHKRIAEHVKEMRAVNLTARQQHEFAVEAVELRGHRRKGILLPESALVARREADKGDSVWQVFNRVQENITKGGMPGVTANGRHIHTRPVDSMSNDVRINAALWEMAMAAVAKARSSSARALKPAKA